MESRIDYWISKDGVEDLILSTDVNSVPHIGETIHIDTKSNLEWHKSKFGTDRFYNEGVREYFKVKSVKRFIRSSDTIYKEKTEKGTYNLPSKSITEVFEVFLVKQD